ncbi:hypothetical protein EXS54_02760 [Patescibacteria group bacterium]|nr:hypothetical protein [Patescibacteria group bacterium]
MSAELPLFHFFLNNGREDMTEAEINGMRLATLKASALVEKNNDGATVSSITYVGRTEERDFPNGDGMSIEDYDMEHEQFTERRAMPEDQASPPDTMKWRRDRRPGWKNIQQNGSRSFYSQGVDEDCPRIDHEEDSEFWDE